MRLSSSPSPDSLRPRPARGAEVASGFKDEEDDGVEFDHRRDLLKKDWEGMKGKLEAQRDNKDWWDFSSMAKNLSLIFPDRSHELNLNKESFDGMK